MTSFELISSHFLVEDVQNIFVFIDQAIGEVFKIAEHEDCAGSHFKVVTGAKGG